MFERRKMRQARRRYELAKLERFILENETRRKELAALIEGKCSVCAKRGWAKP